LGRNPIAPRNRQLHNFPLLPSCPPPSDSVLFSPAGTENATRSQQMPCSCAVLFHDVFFPFGQSLQRKTGRQKGVKKGKVGRVGCLRQKGKVGRVVCLRSPNVYVQSGAQVSLPTAWKKGKKLTRISRRL
jgi:hypothetical protein